MSIIIKARLTKSFADSLKLYGVVHSQFNRTCNIEFVLPEGGTMIISLFPDDADVPDSLAVDGSFFKEISMLPVGAPVVKNGMEFYFSQIDEPLIGTLDCIQPSFLKIDFTRKAAYTRNIMKNMTDFLKTLQEYRKESGKEDGFSSLPEKWRDVTFDFLYDFADSFLAANPDRISKVIPRCMGIGKGLTPSSDDAVIGIIAVLAGAVIRNHPATPEKTRHALVNNSLREILPLEMLQSLTTDISLKYMYCAFDGRFSDTLLKLVEALYSGLPADWMAHIESVAAAGSTSGMDTLVGAAIAVKCIQQKSGFIDYIEIPASGI